MKQYGVIGVFVVLLLLITAGCSRKNTADAGDDAASIEKIMAQYGLEDTADGIYVYTGEVSEEELEQAKLFLPSQVSMILDVQGMLPEADFDDSPVTLGQGICAYEYRDKELSRKENSLVYFPIIQNNKVIRFGYIMQVEEGQWTGGVGDLEDFVEKYENKAADDLFCIICTVTEDGEAPETEERGAGEYLYFDSLDTDLYGEWEMEKLGIRPVNILEPILEIER